MKKHSYLSLLTFLLVSTATLGFTTVWADEPPQDAAALAAQAEKQEALQGIIDRSPLGRYLRSEFKPGVKSFRTDTGCPSDDLVKRYELRTPPTTINYPAETLVLSKRVATIDPEHDVTIQIKDFEEKLSDEIKTELKLFTDAFDLNVINREICIGSAIFPSPNAESMGIGWMIFDPNLFFRIVLNPKTTDWSVRWVVAHEFAHQLQFWTVDPTLNRKKNDKPYARDTELQADCAAAAILYKIRSTSFTRIGTDFNGSVREAAQSLGDFEVHAQNHHGTLFERGLMIDRGAKIAQDLIDKKEFGSKLILDACRDFIDRNNKTFGDDLWSIKDLAELSK